jgi:hypothetical protein
MSDADSQNNAAGRVEGMQSTTPLLPVKDLVMNPIEDRRTQDCFALVPIRACALLAEIPRSWVPKLQLHARHTGDWDSRLVRPLEKIAQRIHASTRYRYAFNPCNP